MIFSVEKATARVSVSLLDECRVVVDGQRVGGVPLGLFRVAAYVLLESRGQAMLRRRVGQLIWSESRAAQASADVRQAVARIRRFQSDHGLRFIAADTTFVWVVKDDNVFCDLEAFLDQLENPAETACVKLCTLYGGDLLGSLSSAGEGFEEWLSFQRTNLRNEFLDRVSKAILPTTSLTRQQRDFCARRLLKVDSCHEGAYRALMRGAAEDGQLSVMRSLFAECSRRLADELGVRPEEETFTLFEKLARRTIAADL